MSYLISSQFPKDTWGIKNELVVTWTVSHGEPCRELSCCRIISLAQSSCVTYNRSGTDFVNHGVFRYFFRIWLFTRVSKKLTFEPFILIFSKRLTDLDTSIIMKLHKLWIITSGDKKFFRQWTFQPRVISIELTSHNK